MNMRRLAYVLLLLTLASVPFEDVVKFPVIGTLSRVLGALAFASWAASAFGSGHMRQPAAFHALVYGYVVWVGLSLFWSLDATATVRRIETYLQLLALALVIWDLCASRRAIEHALQALVVGLGVAAGSLFMNFARGTEAYYGRFAASGADPNYMSLVLALGIPIAWFLWLFGTRTPYRHLNLAYIPAALVAMGLTGSRGGMIAGFVALAYVLSTAKRLSPSGFVAGLVILGAGLSAISYVVPESAIDRIASVSDEIREGDLNGRAGIWLEARDAYVDRPVLGIGAGATRTVLPGGKTGHNVAINLLLELGFVGFVLFAGMAAAAVRSAIAAPRPDRRLWIVLLAIWGIGSLSLSLETRKITWILFSLVVLAPGVWRHASVGSSASAARTDDIGERPATADGVRWSV